MLVFCKETVMTYKAKIIKLDDTGERAILIVDGIGMPVDLPSRYLLGKRETLATQTVLNLGKNICQLYYWADENSCDIYERIRSGYVFGITEIDSLFKYLALNRRQVVNQKATDNNVTAFAGYVSGSMLSQKIDAITGFLSWLGELAVEHRHITDPYYAAIRPAMVDLKEQLNARKVKSVVKPRIGLDDKQQSFLLKVIEPNASLNPFDKRTRDRNYLIIKILLTCGVRLGELLALKNENCHLNGDEPYLYFGHNITKENDPRKMPPDAKTVGRKIYITKNIAAEIDRYINTVRKVRGRAARKAASYLFLNTNIKPAPMTEGAIYHLIGSLRSKFSELADLHPHRLRHTFNDNLVIMFADSMPEEEFLKLQRWLNGWTDDSHEGGTYTHRSQQLRGQRCLIMMQENIIEGNFTAQSMRLSDEPIYEDIPF
jgi:integrase